MKIIKILSLIALVLLVAGCDITMKPEIAGNNNVSQINVSMSGNYRAILPFLEYGFSKYELTAEPGEGNYNDGTAPVEIGEYGGTIELPYGNWFIKVTAFVNVGGAEIEAVYGRVPLFIDSDSYYVIVPVNTPEPGGTGVFNYEVHFPYGANALVKLDSWPIGSNPVFEENAVSNGVKEYEYIPSGIYFLTVSTQYNGKTITKNQIVHIYQESPTYINYNFSEADFLDLITLSGNATILINGYPAQWASLSIYDANYHDYLGWANIDMDDGYWEAIIEPFAYDTDVYFTVNFEDEDGNWFMKEAYVTQTVSLYNVSNIDFIIDITTIMLSGFADITENSTPYWANVNIYRSDSGDHLGTAYVDTSDFYWQIAFEPFSEPTELYFVIETSDYDYYSGFSTIMVYDEDVNSINLSNNKIYLGGKMTFTLNGTDDFVIDNGYINIGTEPGMSDITWIYFEKPYGTWATWIDIDYLDETVYFSVYLNTNIGSGTFDLGSRLLDSSIVYAPNFVGDHYFE